MRMSFHLLAIASTFLTACSGIGVPAVQDPIDKLNQAEALVQEQGRPLMAEMLIQEAVDMCTASGDERCLGHARRGYAELLHSDIVAGKLAPYYQKRGFIDKTSTWATRNDDARRYYNMALDHYARAIDQERAAGRPDLLLNVYFNIGNVQAQLRNTAAACAAYQQALQAYDEALARKPDQKPHSGSPTKTVADLVHEQQSSLGCR